LQCQAFGEIAGEDAGRIEFLQQPQHPLDALRDAAKPLRGALEPALQIAGLIELVEQMEGDDPVGLIGKIGADLLDQVLAEGAGGARGLVDPGQFAGVAGTVAAAPGCIAGDLGRAVALVSRRRPPIVDGVRNRLDGRRLRDTGHVTAVEHRPITRFRSGFGPVVGVPFAPLQQRVLLDLALNQRVQLEIGQLQHLDRLLQLRRHDQTLALAQLKPLRKADSIHKALRWEPGL